MRLEFLHEPELQFGAGNHIDIRFGLMNYGTLDGQLKTAPKQVNLGVVGTSGSTEGFSEWLGVARKGVSAKESKQPHLFPRFPGFGPSGESALQTDLCIDTRTTRTIPNSAVADLNKIRGHVEMVTKAAQTFADEILYLATNAKCDVVTCAIPEELAPRLLGAIPATAIDTDDESHAATSAGHLDFHDLLKAKAMRTGKPTQLVLPSTYLKHARTVAGAVSAGARKLQDEATRAWNLYVALYYKAGGIPWRLVRDATEVDSCYVGIGFYRTLDHTSLQTSIAELFNERGEGVIVRGGEVAISKDDRAPHLSSSAAAALLSQALTIYRQEHKNFPARVVIHKTSWHTEDEIEGFAAALKQHAIELADFVSVRRSTTRLLRHGDYPPLRGTLLSLDDSKHVLYMRGSVPFFRTYPGMYIPRPLEFWCERVEHTPRQLAQEMLALSKMNWNDTQFDGGEPITVKAAKRVGSVLRHVPADTQVLPRYAFYM